MPKYFDIINTKPTRDLIELFEMEEGLHYTRRRTRSGVSYFRVELDSQEMQMAYDLLKDVNIYVPQFNRYLSDFIFMRSEPIRPIVELIERFSVDQLFEAFLHMPKIMQTRKKYENIKK